MLRFFTGILSSLLLTACAHVSAPLPEGFPDPTPEGQIEIKTYPVMITDYHAQGSAGRADVFFLYEDTQQGEPGAYAETVEVMDLAAGEWLSIGVRGPYDHATFKRALGELDRWLYLNSSRFEAAGAPRRLYYNDPFRLPWLLFSDVQVPVRRRSAG